MNTRFLCSQASCAFLAFRGILPHPTNITQFGVLNRIALVHKQIQIIINCVPSSPHSVDSIMPSSPYVPLLKAPPAEASVPPTEAVKPPSPMMPKLLLVPRRRLPADGRESREVEDAVMPTNGNLTRKRLLRTAPRVPDALEDAAFSTDNPLPTCRLRMRPSKVARTPPQRVSYLPNTAASREPLLKTEVYDPVCVPTYLLFPDIPSGRAIGDLPRFQLQPKPRTHEGSVVARAC